MIVQPNQVQFKIVENLDEYKYHKALLEEGLTHIEGNAKNVTQLCDLVYAGKVMLVIGARGLNPKGFFTCFPKDNDLVVWHGYIRQPDPEDGLVLAFDAINDVANIFNTKNVVFHTRRKGWERSFKKHGFSLRCFINGVYTYSKEVY